MPEFCNPFTVLKNDRKLNKSILADGQLPAADFYDTHQYE
jgi:hypothetical protein